MTDERVTAHRIRVGPAGWSYKDWAGQVYPKSQPHGFNSVAYLAQCLDAVETDCTLSGGALGPTSGWQKRCAPAQGGDRRGQICGATPTDSHDIRWVG